MKCLGGGNLINNKEKHFLIFFLFRLYIVAVGMKSVDEVLANVSIFEGRPVDKDIEDRIIIKEETISRRLV